jgi:hypothetical protein
MFEFEFPDTKKYRAWTEELRKIDKEFTQPYKRFFNTYRIVNVVNILADIIEKAGLTERFNNHMKKKMTAVSTDQEYKTTVDPPEGATKDELTAKADEYILGDYEIKKNKENE